MEFNNKDIGDKTNHIGDESSQNIDEPLRTISD